MLASTVAWSEHGANIYLQRDAVGWHLMRFHGELPLRDNPSTGHVWHIRTPTEHDGDCTGVLDQSETKGRAKICMQLQLDICEAPDCWLDEVLRWVMAQQAVWCSGCFDASASFQIYFSTKQCPAPKKSSHEKLHPESDYISSALGTSCVSCCQLFFFFWFISSI